ncbi:hypothetical protein Pla123a_22370 [Posidoniimonas polymericola]|uniref:Uncharacterized protein n=2 Tax=Posidoniimonas polymericola TaxID=2528002 RepID=A0A5C5YRQ0_9BACT|nr:hypothetical protein Pla123a_22370 [Posidoniimonas polymericola]
MGFPEANYPKMVFWENSSEVGFVEFNTSKPAGLAEVYVEFPDGSRHFLPDVTEDVVAKNLEKMISVDPNTPDTTYRDGLSRFVFKDGKLQRLKIEAGLATWKIAAKEEGPYLALPISKADLVKHFGEPDSWDVYVPPRVP